MLTCPRCLAMTPLAFKPACCPRCGLQDLMRTAQMRPIERRAARGVYTIDEVVAYGDLCNLHRCRSTSLFREHHAIIKIPRDSQANAYMRSEAHALRRLLEQDRLHHFAPFLPTCLESIDIIDEPGREPRVANVLAFFAPPEEFHTLAKLREFFPRGLDPKHMAWIWRRLLNVLRFVHDSGVSHNAILPIHVLIEPKEHKLIVVGWCSAHCTGSPNSSRLMSGSYVNWYSRATHSGPQLDISFAARCMLELVGGNGATPSSPDSLDPVFKRYFARCLNPSATESNNAHKLLEDFDHLIEILWGPRRFRPLELPV